MENSKQSVFLLSSSLVSQFLLVAQSIEMSTAKSVPLSSSLVSQFLLVVQFLEMSTAVFRLSK